MSFVPVPYDSLNPRQREIYNFQKIAARLADYGFNCLWLSDDWQGADFLACHIDGKTVLRVQLKSRLTLDRKYIGKEIFIAFRQGEEFFIYPHDGLLDEAVTGGYLKVDKPHWAVNGYWHRAVPPAWAGGYLSSFKV
ncbi:MAG: hypothetical protein Q4G25_05620 [Paracoccus sp. (in: a-proteobacteria)]|nr:hypothetical protein [Paracoccus sp. (in: a-proteobacteria)]